ncbi:Condensin-2 complex subunit G2 [Quillaja saponaria]|uniref:Condensin-2 complex subunit G2 n=1 Tax=Quillaja saponaria TaxID=32244 RepID=A0AAD7P7A3_QUISA|nr:Condensin-2 complex subunit G2 [Quillaja saponaria]
MHPQNAFSPSALLPDIQALRDNQALFELDAVLSSGITILCEEWWKDNLPGRESLFSQSLPFLLARSLTLKKKMDVHRVCASRGIYFCDFEDETIEDLKLLLIRCLISPLYLKTEYGRRLLAFLFGLSNQIVKDTVAMIPSQIPFGRKSILEAYRDFIFRAWKAAEEDNKG